jgi:hypothetical protein
MIYEPEEPKIPVKKQIPIYAENSVRKSCAPVVLTLLAYGGCKLAGHLGDLTHSKFKSITKNIPPSFKKMFNLSGSTYKQKITKEQLEQMIENAPPGLKNVIISRYNTNTQAQDTIPAGYFDQKIGSDIGNHILGFGLAASLIYGFVRGHFKSREYIRQRKKEIKEDRKVKCMTSAIHELSDVIKNSGLYKKIE